MTTGRPAESHCSRAQRRPVRTRGVHADADASRNTRRAHSVTLTPSRAAARSYRALSAAGIRTLNCTDPALATESQSIEIALSEFASSGILPAVTMRLFA